MARPGASSLRSCARVAAFGREYCCDNIVWVFTAGRHWKRWLGILLVCILPTGCTGNDTPPNVILVTVDTLRFDAVGAYGGPVQTPVLDGLAAEGVRVATVLAPAPETGPSHATLFSGRHISTHGMRQNGHVPFATLPLVSAFRRAGYTTAGIVSSYVLKAGFGWDRGFDHYDAALIAKGHERQGPATSRVAAAWLEQAEEPFFLFVHYFDPHMPYRHHPKILARMRGHRLNLEGRHGSPEEKKYWARATMKYQSEVLFFDDALGSLLGALDARGLKDHTLVVLTADHGEGLGEHHWLGHTVHLYDEQIRVPLILRWPERLEAGHVIETILGLVDVAPTLAELVGIELPAPVDGRSIASALRNRTEPDAKPVVGMRRQLVELKVPAMGERHYVRTSRWKYIRGTDGPEELYDLRADPLELDNQATQQRDVAARLSALVDEQQARTPAPSGRGLSKEERESLEALGYVE
jgi:arylsulfatase A-like enzyme